MSVPFKFNTLKTFCRTLPNFLCLFQRSFRSIRSPVRPPRPSQGGFFNRKLSTRQKVIFWTNKPSPGHPPAHTNTGEATERVLSLQMFSCPDWNWNPRKNWELCKQKTYPCQGVQLAVSSFVHCFGRQYRYMIISLRSPWARPPRGRPRWPPPAARTSWARPRSRCSRTDNQLSSSAPTGQSRAEIKSRSNVYKKMMLKSRYTFKLILELALVRKFIFLNLK